MRGHIFNHKHEAKDKLMWSEALNSQSPPPGAYVFSKPLPAEPPPTALPTGDHGSNTQA